MTVHTSNSDQASGSTEGKFWALMGPDGSLSFRGRGYRDARENWQARVSRGEPVELVEVDVRKLGASDGAQLSEPDEPDDFYWPGAAEHEPDRLPVYIVRRTDGTVYDRHFDRGVAEIQTRALNKTLAGCVHAEADKRFTIDEAVAELRSLPR